MKKSRSIPGLNGVKSQSGPPALTPVQSFRRTDFRTEHTVSQPGTPWFRRRLEELIEQTGRELRSGLR